MEIGKRRASVNANKAISENLKTTKRNKNGVKEIKPAKRGRKKKAEAESNGAEKKVTDTKEVESEEAKDTNGTKKEEKKVGKRGRGKKQVVSEELENVNEVPEQAEDVDGTKVEEVTPSKRGRPKKDQPKVEEKKEVEKSTTSKRGRSKKDQPKVEEKKEEAEVSTSVKKGRPKKDQTKVEEGKEETKQVTPSKRGRPSKEDKSEKVVVEVQKSSEEEKDKEAEISPAEKEYKNLKLPEKLVLLDHESKEVNINQLLKESHLVIFTYPKASTPGCTTQVNVFNKELDQFTKKGYKVFGLSNDLPKKNLSFHQKHQLKYPLLCDPENKFIKILEAFQGDKKGAIRSCFIIEKEASKFIAKVKIGPQPSVDWALSMIN